MRTPQSACYRQLPTFPGAQFRGATTSSGYRIGGESGPIAGYGTRFKFELPANATAVRARTPLNRARHSSCPWLSQTSDEASAPCRDCWNMGLQACVPNRSPNEGVLGPIFSLQIRVKPTRGLEPRTPSLRVSTKEGGQSPPVPPGPADKPKSETPEDCEEPGTT